MQFTQLDSENRNLVTEYGAHYVAINHQRYQNHLIVRPSSIFSPWVAPDFEDLQLLHFESILSDVPEILLLGTGNRQRFLERTLWRQLRQHVQGLEIMATSAACRTYNLVAEEGRNVAAALLLEKNDG